MHQPFLDWYDIWAGQACANENGESWLKDPPLGVRLAVQPARRSPVFFRVEGQERSSSAKGQAGGRAPAPGAGQGVFHGYLRAWANHLRPSGDRKLAH